MVVCGRVSDSGTIGPIALEVRAGVHDQTERPDQRLAWLFQWTEAMGYIDCRTSVSRHIFEVRNEEKVIFHCQHGHLGRKQPLSVMHALGQNLAQITGSRRKVRAEQALAHHSGPHIIELQLQLLNE